MASPTSARRAPFLRLLSLALLAGLASCAYNDHRNFGATEKLVASDVHTVGKIPGTFLVAIVDGVISPVTMAWDQIANDEQYSPDHEYFSYSGSRVIARSEMGDGYQWLASVPSLVFETVWFPLTGLVDLVTILMTDPDNQPNAEND